MRSKYRPELLLVALTLVKTALVLFLFQHLVVEGPSGHELNPTYGFRWLVESMARGDYRMLASSGLDDIYDMWSRAYRPPIYPAVLFAASWASHCSPLVLVLVHSIVTSLVAWLGYRIVLLATGRPGPAFACLAILFFFPMNFLKSGSIDEAPLMLVFLLGSAWALGRYVRDAAAGVERRPLLALAGMLVGLATMTRYTAALVAIATIAWLVLGRTSRAGFAIRARRAAIYGASFAVVLAPWIVRNWTIYGEPVLSSGGNMWKLTCQSEEFLRLFPETSIDEIHRQFMRRFHAAHPELSRLDLHHLDKEFGRYAAIEMREHPGKYMRSVAVRMKAFLPIHYYPREPGRVKDLLYVLMYLFSLALFVWGLMRPGRWGPESRVLLAAVLGLAAPGVLYFILSRHLYAMLVAMIVFAFTTLSARDERRPAGETAFRRG